MTKSIYPASPTDEEIRAELALMHPNSKLRPVTGDVAASEGQRARNVKIIEKIIKCCSGSLDTDIMSGGLRCEHCQKTLTGTQHDMWEPIGRSDTYWIRNTLQSMLDSGMLNSPIEGHCESCNIIVDDCDTCVLHRLGDGYEQITKCAIEKSADTSRCTFGSIPENCPLIKNDIVFKLKKGARVMSPIEGQEE